tara:strand:- start:2974 stop:3468 length:495 start_codon:yes stop_codon:yes gene_type:complete
MADGNRILESGSDTRILESGATRITENFVPAETSLVGTGTQVAVASLNGSADANLTGTGTQTVVATSKQSASFGPITGSVTRVLESGDIRITEGGDTRIAADVVVNSGESTITINGTLVLFLSEAYIKQAGVWTVFTPYIQYKGNWQVPEKLSKNISDDWKRIY